MEGELGVGDEVIDAHPVFHQFLQGISLQSAADLHDGPFPGVFKLLPVGAGKVGLTLKSVTHRDALVQEQDTLIDDLDGT